MSRVETYRNLHTGTFSVRALEGARKGRVFFHPTRVVVDNATFVVQPAGNAKVRVEGKKNVHAFVRGDLNDTYVEVDEAVYRKATYNPYQNDTFVDKETGQPVLRAARVILDIDTGVWYTDGVV